MENGQRKKKYPMSGRSLDDNTGVNYEQEAEFTQTQQKWAETGQRSAMKFELYIHLKDMKAWLHPALFQLFSLVMA